MAKVRDNQTGQIFEVPDSDLGSYGLSSPSTQTPTQTGISKEQLTDVLLSPNIQEKTKTRVKEVYELNQGSDKEKETKQFKSKVSQSAQGLLDVLDKGQSGKLKGDAYKDALNFASAEFSKSAFGEGGKQLSESEQAIIQGSIPRIEMKSPTVIQRLLGQKPTQTGKVIDPEDVLRRKALLAKEYLTTGKYSPELFEQLQQTNKPGFDFGSFMQGDIQTAKDLVQAGRTLPQQGGLLNLLLKNPGQFAQSTAEGIGEDIGQAVQDPGGTLYRNPVGSALNVLGAGSLLKSILKRGATTAAKTAVGEASNMVPPSGGGPLQKLLNISSNARQDVKGRLATSIAVPNPESVSQSEKLMGKILTATKSNSVRGMAKETEEVIPKAGQIIDSEIGNLNNSIGSMPRDEVIEQVLQKISSSSEAKTNPKLLGEIRQILREELKSGQLQGGEQAGELFATDLLKINSTRKSLNADLTGWHGSNRPVGTPTNDLNSLKWQASNALKDIISEADEGNIIARSLDLQHTAFETIGPLSKKALSENNMGLWRTAATKLYDAFIKPGQIAGARRLQGAGTDVAQMVRSGQLPSVPSQLPPQLQQVLRRPMKTESPLPVYPNTPLGDVLHLKRDFRFKQGNFQSRKSK